MSRDALAGLVGAIFGLVFILVNAGDLPGPHDLIVRVLGAAAFVGVAVLLFRRGDSVRSPDVGRSAIRVYWTTVLVEAVALFLGARLLSASGHGDLTLPWVVLVVGIHFVPLARAFRTRFYLVLAAILIALAVLGGGLAITDAGSVAVAVACGICPGLALLGFGALPALRRPQPD